MECGGSPQPLFFIKLTFSRFFWFRLGEIGFAPPNIGGFPMKLRTYPHSIPSLKRFGRNLMRNQGSKFAGESQNCHVIPGFFFWIRGVTLRNST